MEDTPLLIGATFVYPFTPGDLVLLPPFGSCNNVLVDSLHMGYPWILLGAGAVDLALGVMVESRRVIATWSAWTVNHRTDNHLEKGQPGLHSVWVD